MAFGVEPLTRDRIDDLGAAPLVRRERKALDRARTVLLCELHRRLQVMRRDLTS
jgi:hypothetical protein